MKEGNLHNMVNNSEIKNTHSNWMSLANLKYQELQLLYPNIPEHLNYNRELTLNSMLRP